MRTIEIDASQSVTVAFETVTEAVPESLLTPNETGAITFERMHTRQRITVDGHPYRVAFPAIVTRNDGQSVMHAKSELTGEEVFLWIDSTPQC